MSAYRVTVPRSANSESELSVMTIDAAPRAAALAANETVNG